MGLQVKGGRDVAPIGMSLTKGPFLSMEAAHPRAPLTYGRDGSHINIKRYGLGVRKEEENYKATGGIRP